MKYSVTKEVQFDAGHRVPLHDSKCKNPHGHRYRVEITVEGDLVTTGSSTGMVVDFSHLKALMQTHIHDRYDHSFIAFHFDHVGQALLDADPEFKVVIVNFHPTAENLARDIFLEFDALVYNLWRAKLTKVAVWETPTSVATVEAT